MKVLDERKKIIAGAKRLVVKIGTNALSLPDGGIDAERVRHIAEQLHVLRSRGLEVILVSSGAIGTGVSLLGLSGRPKTLPLLQAAAAVGQSRLIMTYDEGLSRHGYRAAQILLTREDLNDRRRYLNVRNTLRALLDLPAVPIINENDTVSVDEIKFGDNDMLLALVTNLMLADLLIVLSVVDGLYANDSEPGTKTVIPVVRAVSDDVRALDSGNKSDHGTGGMSTKLQSVQMVTQAGEAVILANGRTENVLVRIMDGEQIGTLFLPGEVKMPSRKRWIGMAASSKGSVVVDDGAKRALLERGKSLLASGIKEVKGAFEEGDVVSVADQSHRNFARGLTNYSSDDVSKITGLKSNQFEQVLGYKSYDEVIHRDNLVILRR